MRVRAVGILIGVVATAGLAGCGDSGAPKDGGQQEAAAVAVPSSVSPADLDRDGRFWAVLPSGLKYDLVQSGIDRLAAERPAAKDQFDTLAEPPVEREIDKQYATPANRSRSIYAALKQANDTLAKHRYDKIRRHLERLQNGE